MLDVLVSRALRLERHVLRTVSRLCARWLAFSRYRDQRTYRGEQPAGFPTWTHAPPTPHRRQGCGPGGDPFFLRRLRPAAAGPAPRAPSRARPARGRRAPRRATRGRGSSARRARGRRPSRRSSFTRPSLGSGRRSTSSRSTSRSTSTLMFDGSQPNRSASCALRQRLAGGEAERAGLRERQPVRVRGALVVGQEAADQLVQRRAQLGVLGGGLDAIRRHRTPRRSRPRAAPATAAARPGRTRSW